jgi:putative peptidoglycan lipid II flippase
MFKSTLNVSVLAALCTGISFLNQLVLARYFGTTGEMDAYLIAISIPLTISSLLAGIFNYQLVPALQKAESFSKGADSLMRSLTFGIGGTSALVGIVGAILSRLLIQVLNPRLPADEQRMIASLAHVTWLCLPMATLGTIFTAGLHVRQRFLSATVLTAAPMTVSLIACVVGHSHFGIASAVYGQLLGYVGMAVGLRLALGCCRKGWDWKSLKRIVEKIPLALGAVLIFVLFPFSDAFWGSRIGPSAVSYLGFAQRILVGLSGLAVVGATTVLFPRLARRAAQGENHELRQDMGLSMRVMLVCMVPAATAFGVLSSPTIQLLFERGAFLHSDTIALSELLRPMLFGMTAMSCIGLMFKGLFAREETTFAAVLSLIGSFVYIALSGILSRSAGVNGIGYSYAAAWWAVFLIGLRHIWSEGAFRSFATVRSRFILNLACLAAVVGLICFAGLQVLQVWPSAVLIERAAVLLLTVSVSIIAYIILGNMLFAIAEIQILTRQVFKLIKRS